MKTLVRKALVLVSVLGLVACAASDSGSSSSKRPRYALSNFSGGYVVNCARLEVKVASLRDFYHDDGTQKTEKQVCREFDPGTRIKR